MTTVEGKNVPNANVEVVKNGTGEIIRMGPAQMRVLEDGSHTDQRIGSAELTVPPKTPGPPQHWHQVRGSGGTNGFDLGRRGAGSC
jgi:hypothetical protein